MEADEHEVLTRLATKLGAQLGRRPKGPIYLSAAELEQLKRVFGEPSAPTYEEDPPMLTTFMGIPIHLEDDSPTTFRLPQGLTVIEPGRVSK